MDKKIKALNTVLKLVKKFKKQGKIIGFTNGCFDILHPGHIDYLQRAKKYVDVLIVGLNSDRSVKKIKGKTRPFNKELDRALVLSGLNSVDYITIFDSPTPYELINLIRPHYLFKGSDWKNSIVVGRDILESYGGKVVLFPYLKGYSTTKLIKRIWKRRYIV